MNAKGLALRTIALDPGHGGADAGCVHNGIIEHAYVYRIATECEVELRKRGWWPRKLRQFTEDPSHKERANRTLGCVPLPYGVISIHVNAHPDPTEHGPLAFFRQDDWKAKDAARIFIEKIDRKKGHGNTQVYCATPEEWPRVHNCLEHHTLPAVLLELEYATHPDSALWLLEEHTRIVSAICDCAEAFCV